MRLTRKFTIGLAAAILVVLATNSIVRVKREIALFEGDMERDSRLLGRSIAGAAARTWKRVGPSEALDLVADANERESGTEIRWVWLDGGDPAHTPKVPQELIPEPLTRPVVVRWQAPDADEGSLYTYVPLALRGGRPAAVELQESLAAEADYLRTTILQASIATTALVVLCAFLAHGIVVFFIGRPVRELVAHARRIGEGDLATRLHVRQRDEIGELAREMNAMSESLARASTRIAEETAAKVHAVEQLRHADRLATVGKLAAGIAHEVGTPLNVITGYAQLIMDEHPPETGAHANAVVIAQQANRVAGIVRQLLDFARRRSPRLAREELATLATQAVALLEALARKRGVTVTVEAPEPVHGLVDAGQLHQVLTNLVVNAIQASPAGTAVRVEVTPATATSPADLGARTVACARIVVTDEGEGIASEHRARVFEPFFTTKDVGEGTGLGLSVAYGIVRDHGGWIDVASEVGAGTRFTVYLPLEKTPAEGSS